MRVLADTVVLVNLVGDAEQIELLTDFGDGRQLLAREDLARRVDGRAGDDRAQRELGATLQLAAARAQALRVERERVRFEREDFRAPADLFDDAAVVRVVRLEDERGRADEVGARDGDQSARPARRDEKLERLGVGVNLDAVEGSVLLGHGAAQLRDSLGGAVVVLARRDQLGRRAGERRVYCQLRLPLHEVAVRRHEPRDRAYVGLRSRPAFCRCHTLFHSSRVCQRALRAATMPIKMKAAPTKKNVRRPAAPRATKAMPIAMKGAARCAGLAIRKPPADLLPCRLKATA